MRFLSLDPSSTRVGFALFDGDTLVEAGNIKAPKAWAAERRVKLFDIGGRFWLDVDSPEAMDTAEDALRTRQRSQPNDG